MTKLTRFTYLFVVAVVAIASTLVVNYFIMAWTEPTGIPPEGAVNITVDWNDVTNKPSYFQSDWGSTLDNIPAGFSDNTDNEGSGGGTFSCTNAGWVGNGTTCTAACNAQSRICVSVVFSDGNATSCSFNVGARLCRCCTVN